MSTLIGTNVRRSDGPSKVAGGAIFGIDHAEARMLHGALVRSPVAAGRIVRLDSERARQLPGVRAIVTAADVPAVRGGWLLKDQRLFADGDVRHVGEPVAAIAADSLAAAEAAVAAVELEIEEVAPVLDLDAALADGARLVHPEWQSFVSIVPAPRDGNVAWEAGLEQGDVAAAFAAADLVVEDEYRTPRQHQCSIEPHVAVARYENGRYIVHSPAQFPFLARDRVAELLGVTVSAVRVIVPTIGGGFGGKIDALLEPFACVLARATGRPVRLANTRGEELRTTGPRESSIVRLRTAVAADGTILGQEGEILVDNGACSGETAAIVSVAPLALGSTYRIPAARYRSRAVYTNTPPTAAFRGVAGPYCVFAQEQQLDRIARELGMDRRELRLRNAVRAGDTLVNGQAYAETDLLEAFAAVDRIAPWADLTAARRPLRGVGVAAVTWFTNPGSGNATVKLGEDGTVGVVSGGTEIGTGALATGVRQIVAEELGVPVEHVQLLEPDTDAAGYDAGAQGSRTLFAVGNAARGACESVRAQVFETASALLEAAEDDLELVDGHVGVSGSPGSRLPLAAIAQTALLETGPIAATAKHIAPPIAFDSGCVVGALFTALAGVTSSVHLAEVEVDPDTGRVDILRYVVAQDVGRAINPQMIAGQVHGGVAQGIGYALYEDLRMQDGHVVSDSLESYRLPTAADMPHVELALLEHPCEYGPLGAKGAAEPPVIPVAAAIASAVSDAIGRPVHRLPLTPFQILELLDGGDAR